jgi:tetratricopeptide (TPR) repeat protein
MTGAGPASRGAAADPCLGETEAVAYVEGRLSDDARARATRHIDRCDVCGWLISELARATSPPASAPDVVPGPAVSDADGALVPGRRVGRYVVGERLGSGGMGVVYAAYDPELDRSVALKVVHPGVAHPASARARLMVEARAMARLSHPSVLPIYHVHAIGEGHVALAMERVDGPDAQRWLVEARPGWREVLAVLIPAGRGLAAAHAAGIVHRDVKPANFLIGRDGRARITDFGLARTELPPGDVAEGSPAGEAPSGTARSTGTGGLVGTPAYMAPEQRLGQTASALSDQFSFCLVLYEAVYGRRNAEAPVAPAGTADHRRSTGGGVRRPTSGSTAPAWLRRILRRGLAAESARRWPSLAALLDALEDAPRRRRQRWLLAGGAAAMLAIAGGAVAISLAGDPCSAGAADLERVWPAADRAAALARIAGLGPYGQVLAPRIAQGLGGHATQWLAGYRDACTAHHRGAQSVELLDRRIACLERSRLALAAVADVVRSTVASTLPEAILAVRSLPEPAACADVLAMLAPVPPPPRELAARVAIATATLERAQVYLAAGRSAEAREYSRTAVSQARDINYRPLLARALLSEGRAAMTLDDRAAAVPLLSEAMTVGIAAADDALAVEAWARAAWVKGTNSDDFHDALAGVEIIEAMAARAGPGSFARALLHNNLGSLAFSRGKRDEARALLQKALIESRAVVGPGAVELINVRANAASVVDDPGERDVLLGQAETEMAQLVGAEHPEVLRFRMRRAMFSPTLGAARDLLGSVCEAYQRLHHRLAAESALECWGELGYVDGELGDREAGAAAMARAAALPVQRLAVAGEASGYLALWRGDVPGANERFASALADIARRPDEPWWDAFTRGKIGVGLGRARRSAGDLDAARAALEQAVAELVEVRRQHAVAIIDRRLARGRAELAQVLIATHQPRSRIAEVARAAAADLRAEGARAEEIAALEFAAAKADRP